MALVWLQIERHDDVVRLRMRSAGSRAAGLDVSAYVVRDTLIDTGFPHARAQLGRAVAGLGVRGVVVTHWHEDHAGNVELFARGGIPLHLDSATDAKIRQRPAIQLYRRVVWGRPPALRSPVVSLDPGPLEVIATPGHSTDHHVVWDAATETVFSGDLWLGVRSAIMHRDEDPYVMLDSLRRVHGLGPRRMFDAHRGLIEDASRALLARITWLSATIARIEHDIAAGWSDRAIVRAVLGGEAGAAYVSLGEYSRRNFVRAVRRHGAAASGA
jgi:endoribonuclease LACTB2